MADFVWGEGGSQDSPTTRRRLAEQLILQGTSTAPVQHWTQGAARVAQALLGTMELRDEDRKYREAGELLMNNPALQGGVGSNPALGGGMRTSDLPPATGGVSPTAPYSWNTMQTDTGDTIPAPPRNPLGGMDPEYRTKFADLRTAAADKGATFDAPTGGLGATRTPEQQAALYAQGRTAPGPVVTQTLNSNHIPGPNGGRAMDVVPTNGTSADAIGKVVSALTQSDPRLAGMRSGADFKSLYDPLHVELNQPGQQQGGNWPVRVASLDPSAGMARPSGEAMGGAMPQQAAPAQAAHVQVAQAQQPGQQPPAFRQMPPEISAYVRKLLANPQTRAYGVQMLGQYTTPRDQWIQERNADGSIYQRNSLTGEMKAIEKSDVLPELAVTQKERIAAAGKPVTTIDQRAPDEFEKEYGQGMGKRALDVIAQGDTATRDLQESALSRSFLTKVQTGAISPAQATVGAWAKAVGINPATLGIDPNLPAISQAAQSAIAQQTVSMIGSGGFPANNFSDADRKFLQSIPANMGNTPEANTLLLDVKDRVAQRKVERANAWADARDNKISYEKFESSWRKKVAGEDIFADVRGKVDALTGGGWQDIGGVKIRKKEEP